MAQNLNHRPRRINLAILVVGTIAAIACAFGPISMVRAGVAVSVLTAVASVVLTWRQMNELVREHLAEVHALREAHSGELRAVTQAHHAESMAMIERFNERKVAFTEQIVAAQAEIAELRSSLASSELDNEAKQTRISALNKRVSDLENEVAAVDDAVTKLPRLGLDLRALDLSKLPLVYPIDERKHA